MARTWPCAPRKTNSLRLLTRAKKGPMQVGKMGFPLAFYLGFLPLTERSQLETIAALGGRSGRLAWLNRSTFCSLLRDRLPRAASQKRGVPDSQS